MVTLIAAPNATTISAIPRPPTAARADAPRSFVIFVLLVLLGGLFSGCASTAVGAGAVGATAVVQERAVGDAIDDAAIVTEINRNWLMQDHMLPARVSAEAVEGRVVLTGTVRTPEERIEALRLAWQADGIREMANEIQVTDQSDLGDIARDSWISAQLATKLLFDREVLSINYSSEAVNGVVYLMGIAQNQKEADRVTEHARNIRYVRKVVSHIRLKFGAKQSS